MSINTSTNLYAGFAIQNVTAVHLILPLYTCNQNFMCPTENSIWVEG